MALLEAIPAGFFSRSLDLIEDGVLVATMKTGWTGRSAEFQREGVSFLVRASGIFSLNLELHRGGVRIARAWRRRILSRNIEVEAGDRFLVLAPRSLFGWTFELTEGDESLGEIRPTGLFRTGFAADLPGDLPLPLRVFLGFILCAARRSSRNRN